MRSTNLIAALSATALLGLATTADAKTYCVGAPAGCPADGVAASLDGALSAAQASGGPDEIRVGAGTFKTPQGFKYAAASDVNTIQIHGAGPDQTILRPDTDAKGTFTTLSVDAAGESAVDGLGIVAPARLASGDKTRGARLTGLVTAEHLRITEPAGGIHPSEGVLLDGAHLVSSRIELSTGTGVQVEGDRSVIVNDCAITARIGLRSLLGGPVTVYRTRIAALQYGVMNNIGADVSLASVLVRLTADDATGLQAQASSGYDARIKATNVTIEGYDHGGTTAVSASALGGYDAGIKLDNTILHGVSHGLARFANHADSQAVIQGQKLNYDSSHNTQTGGGVISVANGTDVDPGFADVAGGDFRLARTSPLIDTGIAMTFVALPGLDAAGGTRKVGDALDLGAFEHQHAAPVAAIAPQPETLVGQSVELDGAGSNGGDPGDAIAAWAWSFGDGGTSVQGPQTTHVWAMPGTYQVSLKVTDLDGKSATTTRTVVVKALPTAATPAGSGSGSGSGSGTGSGTATGGTGAGGGTAPVVMAETPVSERPATSTNPVAPDRTAPVVSGLRRRGRAVRFSLSESAAVKVRVERRAGRRFRGVGRAKRLAGAAGRNALRIRRLAPGRYRLVVTAVDAAGNRGVKRLAFRVG
ncbi:MAG TPA: PKD domain-containing protein [Solirubrobacteraceae bacterium]|jgi:hypothetical protein